MTTQLRTVLLPALAALTLAACNSTAPDVSSTAAATQVKGQLVAGATMVATTNLHIDPTRKRLYAMNYQLPTVMPVCSEVTITDVSEKAIEFTYNGERYEYLWDKYTKGAGQSLSSNFTQYFGDRCDQDKIKTLSKVDQEGIAAGRPMLGMSKEGVLIAMGRPPIHANPDLTAATWTYWENKWGRKQLVFNEAGKIKQIID